MFVTKRVISMQFGTYRIAIPANTKCQLIRGGPSKGNFFVDSFEWIPERYPGLYYDIVHHGIILDKSEIKENV